MGIMKKISLLYKNNNNKLYLKLKAAQAIT